MSKNVKIAKHRQSYRHTSTLEPKQGLTVCGGPAPTPGGSGKVLMRACGGAPRSVSLHPRRLASLASPGRGGARARTLQPPPSAAGLPKLCAPLGQGRSARAWGRRRWQGWETHEGSPVLRLAEAGGRSALREPRPRPRRHRSLGRGPDAWGRVREERELVKQGARGWAGLGWGSRCPGCLLGGGGAPAAGRLAPKPELLRLRGAHRAPVL